MWPSLGAISLCLHARKNMSVTPPSLSYNTIIRIAEVDSLFSRLMFGASTNMPRNVKGHPVSTVLVVAYRLFIEVAVQ